MKDVVFLTLADVLSIHEDRIRKYGGSSGVRDLALLGSALGSVRATFEGRFLHESLFEMGAAYLFGICMNHPFIDRNKRTALACALVFLELNDVSVLCEGDELYELVIGVTEGRVSKAAIAVFFEQHG